MDYLGIDKEKAMPVVSQLNNLLSNYQIYYQNLRNFHWNIQGKNFFDLHHLFEDLYNDARVKIDEVAERILTLRSRPLSRMTDYLTVGTIPEATLVEDDHEMVLILLANHKILIDDMRAVIKGANNIGDEGTIDMIGGFLGNLEKKSWMLDAWATRARKNIMA